MMKGLKIIGKIDLSLYYSNKDEIEVIKDDIRSICNNTTLQCLSLEHRVSYRFKGSTKKLALKRIEFTSSDIRLIPYYPISEHCTSISINQLDKNNLIKLKAILNLATEILA